ncbi:MAG: alpha-amylase family glycosyl hydrolase, partial [Bacteroidota bacterium]|nr:alpha-amylase family glycosyl hydrolase [Bacteroidota bacterium]
YILTFKKGKQKMVRTYELFARKQGSAERNSFNASDVVYLLMPDRFANGNPKNDNIEGLAEKANRKIDGGRHGGDIQGIIDHLDYLKDLGITAIWSTPLLEDNEPTFSYHGYATSDYYKIDGRYGTNEDYRRLADECHKRGLKLIMDMVPNHCGMAHWWMKDLPAQDWIHQFPTYTQSNFRASSINDPYASENDRMLNSDGWFDRSMPDLNQRNPQMLNYLRQYAIWWTEYAGLDGLRVDTYPYNDKLKIAEWTKGIINEYPNLNMVGECWQHRQSEIAYWQAGTKNYDGYESGLKSVMDFCFHDQVANAFNEDNQGWDQGMVRFYSNLTSDYLYANPLNMFVFTENHDTQRFTTSINSDVKKYKLAYTLLFTTRGIPQVYYGFEIMMGGDKGKGDGDIRRDFPGGWIGDTRNAFIEAGRTSVENEVFNYIRTLLNWRKNNPVVQFGKLKHYVPEDNVYVYFRYDDHKRVMVVLNDKNESKTISTARFSEMLNGYSSGRDILTGNVIKLNEQVTVPGKTGLILELE